MSPCSEKRLHLHLPGGGRGTEEEVGGERYIGRREGEKESGRKKREREKGKKGENGGEREGRI